MIQCQWFKTNGSLVNSIHEKFDVKGQWNKNVDYARDALKHLPQAVNNTYGKTKCEREKNSKNRFSFDFEDCYDKTFLYREIKWWIWLYFNSHNSINGRDKMKWKGKAKQFGSLYRREKTSFLYRKSAKNTKNISVEFAFGLQNMEFTRWNTAIKKYIFNVYRTDLSVHSRKTVKFPRFSAFLTKINLHLNLKFEIEPYFCSCPKLIKTPKKEDTMVTWQCVRQHSIDKLFTRNVEMMSKQFHTPRRLFCLRFDRLFI